jgi:hypothetical protein
VIGHAPNAPALTLKCNRIARPSVKLGVLRHLGHISPLFFHHNFLSERPFTPQTGPAVGQLTPFLLIPPPLSTLPFIEFLITIKFINAFGEEREFLVLHALSLGFLKSNQEL